VQRYPPEVWERALKRAGLPEHLTRRLVTMAELNRASPLPSDLLSGGWPGSGGLG
jgi:hypothetical protein